jgi:hypothetical protein
MAEGDILIFLNRYLFMHANFPEISSTTTGLDPPIRKLFEQYGSPF